MPTVAKMKALAELLAVDEGWRALRIYSHSSIDVNRLLPRKIEEAIFNTTKPGTAPVSA